MTERGFLVENSNTLSLLFTIPKQRDGNMIQKAELWIFPDMTSSLATFQSPVTVAMLATAHLANSRRPRTDSFTFTWKPEEGCIPIDLTQLTLKLARKISSEEQDEVNVTITLEVLDAFVTGQSTSLVTEGGCGDLLPACISLQQRTSNTPFLVIKYFTYNGESKVAGVEGEGEEGEQEEGASDAKRHLPGRRREAPDDGNCKLERLLVNLTDIYGDFVVRPLQADIRDCSGTCDSSQFKLYSSHALVKERMNYFTGDAGLSVCCSPSEFEPLELLIYQDGYFLIVEFSDLVATKCSCR